MTLHEFLHNQEQFCKDRGYPMFVPSDGTCSRCHALLWKADDTPIITLV